MQTKSIDFGFCQNTLINAYFSNITCFLFCAVNFHQNRKQEWSPLNVFFWKLFLFVTATSFVAHTRIIYRNQPFCDKCKEILPQKSTHCVNRKEICD